MLLIAIGSKISINWQYNWAYGWLALKIWVFGGPKRLMGSTNYRQ